MNISIIFFYISSVQFSHSVMPNSLWPIDCSTPGFPVQHQLLELDQTHVHRVGDAIQPSHLAVPFSFCLQSFPASGSFPMSQFSSSGGQRSETSASASVLLINIQDWFPLGLTGWISLQSKGLKSLLQHHSSKASILQCSAFFIVQLLHDYWKNHSFD